MPKLSLQVSESTHAAYEVLTHHHAPSSASLASLASHHPHPRKLQRARSRTASLSLKSALQSLVGQKPKPSRDSDAPISRAKSKSKRDADADPASATAIKLFAVRELEDDLAERRGVLGRLCAEFAGTDDGQLGRLQALQGEMDEVMDQIRLTATKLQAVRSFAG